MSDERPPPEGKLLFRFKMPEHSPRQTRTWDICEEYAVTDFEDDGTGWAPPPDHCQLLVWGRLRDGQWETNVNARPVVFELLKRLREAETGGRR